MVLLTKLAPETRDLVKKYYKKWEEQQKKNISIHEKWEYQSDPNLIGNEQCDGEKRMKLLLKTLERIDALPGFKRSNQQREMHLKFATASFRKVYGKDYRRHIVRFLKENNLTEVRSDCIVLTPRRFGKTTAVAMYVAAYLLSMPGQTVRYVYLHGWITNILESIYSTGRRASRKLLALIYKLVYELLNHNDKRVPIYNQAK